MERVEGDETYPVARAIIYDVLALALREVVEVLDRRDLSF